MAYGTPLCHEEDRIVRLTHIITYEGLVATLFKLTDLGRANWRNRLQHNGLPVLKNRRVFVTVLANIQDCKDNPGKQLHHHHPSAATQNGQFE